VQDFGVPVRSKSEQIGGRGIGVELGGGRVWE
jgi:hypothetical protein